MENQIENQPPRSTSGTTALSLTELHMKQWLDMLDYLRDSQALTDELAFCQGQITRLQGELYQLRRSS